MSSHNFWIVPGRKCWVELSLTDIFYNSTILQIDETLQKAQIEYIDPNQNQNTFTITIDFSKLYEMNLDFQTDFCDMVYMNFLNEAEILRNLKIRYLNNDIFTYIGPTLIIINPYKAINRLSDPKELLPYQKEAKSDIFNEKINPPHVYAIASKAYFQLFKTNKNQAIVISGESGAGKTENTKYAMKFLTSLTFNTKRKSILENGFFNKEKIHEHLSIDIEDQILSCNPILEAFGNSKTIRNDNSSRFGKYVKILVDVTSQKIKGAFIINYLLEKSRITTQAIGERNYHIFYHLLKCQDKNLLKKYDLVDGEKILDCTDFEYLKKSGCFEVPSLDNKILFEQLVLAFESLHFLEKEIHAVWTLVSSILFIGNLVFDGTNYSENNACNIIDKSLLAKIAEKLCISPEKLEKGMVQKNRNIGNQIIESPMRIEECISMRDSLSRALYERLFNWLVLRLNDSLYPSDPSSNKFIYIGLLDIFGFENFPENSFEQLCINYTNEKLQQIYISYVFKSEQEEFKTQGLEQILSKCSFEDNQDVIDLMDGKQGVFDCLDDACAINKNDEYFIMNLNKNYEKNPKIKFPKLNKDKFIINHTAQSVEYKVIGFLLKNKDSLSPELEQLLIYSQNNEISQIFTFVESKEKASLTISGKSKIEKYLASKFRLQMKELMNELFKCDAHFVRCIKPNELKQKDNFNSEFILKQIKYLGVLESIKIRKNGFAYRRSYQDFYSEYKFLDNDNHNNSNDFNFINKCKKILISIFDNDQMDQVLFGNSKLYMKQNLADILEKKLLFSWKLKQKKALKIFKQFKHYNFRKKIIQGLKKWKKMTQKIKKIQIIFKKKNLKKKLLIKNEKTKKLMKILQTFYNKKNFKIFRHKTILLGKLKIIEKGLFQIKNFLQKKTIKDSYKFLQRQIKFKILLETQSLDKKKKNQENFEKLCKILSNFNNIINKRKFFDQLQKKIKAIKLRQEFLEKKEKIQNSKHIINVKKEQVQQINKLVSELSEFKNFTAKSPRPNENRLISNFKAEFSNELKRNSILNTEFIVLRKKSFHEVQEIKINAGIEKKFQKFEKPKYANKGFIKSKSNKNLYESKDSLLNKQNSKRNDPRKGISKAMQEKMLFLQQQLEGKIGQTIEPIKKIEIIKNNEEIQKIEIIFEHKTEDRPVQIKTKRRGAQKPLDLD